jgi:mRNA interferase MazF
MSKLIVEKKTVTVAVAVVEDNRPPRIKPRLKSAPKIRELFWCDFPEDAQLPELWKTRAVLIVSYRNTLNGTATILPCSGQDQQGNKWALELPVTIDGKPSWVICDKPTSFAVSRLSSGRYGVIRLSEEQYQPILDKMLIWLTPGKRVDVAP